MRPRSPLLEAMAKGKDMPEDRGKGVFRKPMPQEGVEAEEINTDGCIVQPT